MITHFKHVMSTISDSLASIDNGRFNLLLTQSAGALRNGNKIVLSGLGKNVPICEKAVGTLLSLGLDSVFLHANTAMHGDLGAVKNGDIVILLSKSGNTREIIELTEHLLKREITLWLITFEKGSRLQELVQNTIDIELDNEGDKWNIMPNNSSVINLLLLQALAVTLADELDIPLEVFKRNHPGGKIGEILRE